MRPWQFSRPKGPGFGISGRFYLSVLSSASVMPSMLQVVNPAGEGGAVVGLGAPLAMGATKESLGRPLERGAYAVASKDRKTVIKMLVMSPDEAGFDPEVFAQSAFALTADPELLARLRGTWTLSQLRFESHDPAVYPALDFLIGTVARLAQLSDGVVADSIGQRYLLPEQVVHHDRLDPRIDARDYVSVVFRLTTSGVHAYTLGMQKFELPEFEIGTLLETDQDRAARFLIALCQSVLLGDLSKLGDRYGAPKATFQVAEGGFDLGLWEGVKVYELLPPTDTTASEALAAWAREAGLPGV